MQVFSYTLILIYQHLKQPGSTPAEVELHVDSHVQKIKNSLAGHQQELSYTLILNI